MKVLSQSDFDQVVKMYNDSLRAFFKGDPEPVLKIYSDKDDISLAPPFGPFVLGRKLVADTARVNAKKYREGMDTNFENLTNYITSHLAFIVQIERTKAKVGGKEEFSNVALRVTSIFRREEGNWKLVHRHADPIMSARPAESVEQK